MSVLEKQPAAVVVEHIRRYASTGYVRNQLLVLDGGAGAATASGGGDGTQALATGAVEQTSVVVESRVAEQVDIRLERIREARLKGYEGETCGECGNFTLVRNGTCLKCATCGATSGCS